MNALLPVRRFTLTLLAGLLAVTGGSGAPAVPRLDQLDVSKLYGEIIPGYIGTIAMMVQWPKDALAEGAPFRIGILGTDPFGAALAEAVANRKLHGHAIAIVRGAEPQALSECQIVFSDHPSPATVHALGAAFAGKPVLTMVFSPRVKLTGGLIQFYVVADGSVRFTLDTAGLHRAQLKPSLELLQFALRAPPR